VQSLVKDTTERVEDLQIQVCPSSMTFSRVEFLPKLCFKAGKIFCP
jgi:hypothetical protein